MFMENFLFLKYQNLKFGNTTLYHSFLILTSEDKAILWRCATFSSLAFSSDVRVFRVVLLKSINYCSFFYSHYFPVFSPWLSSYSDRVTGCESGWPLQAVTLACHGFSFLWFFAGEEIVLYSFGDACWFCPPSRHEIEQLLYCAYTS